MYRQRENYEAKFMRSSIMAAFSIYDCVLFLFLILYIANAQNVCRDGGRAIIGSDDNRKYQAEVRDGGRLYLNTDNPAQCSGFITQLEYCYYQPDDLRRTVNIGIYREQFSRRRQRVEYQLQTIPIRLSGFLLNEEFSCVTLRVFIFIQEGDIIGACLPGINSLDVVSDISNEESDISGEGEDEEGDVADDEFQSPNASLSYIESINCFTIPLIIDKNDTRIQELESRKLHFFARITSFTGKGIPTTNSGSTSFTTPTVTVTDSPVTEPDNSNISITLPNTSQFPSTFSLGQPFTPVVATTVATSSEASDSIQSTTSIYVEKSGQILVTPTTFTNNITTSLRSLTSVWVPDLMSLSPIITQSPSTETLPPISATRATTVSSSTELSSPGQPVIVLSSFEYTNSLAVTTSGPQRLEQRPLNTAWTVIIILVVLAFVVLTAALVGIFARKYRKKRYRYYPAFKHRILEEDESTYSETDTRTIARFDNVLYSNYNETVQIQDARGKLGQVYDNHEYDSSIKGSEPQPLESTYSEVQEEVDSNSYSYAVISDEFHTPGAQANSRLPDQRPYDPNRESLLSVFCAPASKESDLYAQLKLCGVKNIRRDAIEATENLGSGQFGEVKKGIWRNEKLKVPVALKTLKEGSEQVDKVKFLQEAAIMAQFSHPNVAVLYGVVSKGEPIILVVELVEKGNLLDHLAFLKENNDSIQLPNLPNILLNFSLQVALGMRYLSERGFVHRDLAARNILVSSDDICKIADFGMSRDLADENYYVSQGGKIPVKWTAPEAINYKKYSTASDVWSYGCLLYEIWSLGHKPYENQSNLQVIRCIEFGQRLSPPPGCPRKIYELMIFCWNPEVAFRPKFSDLALILVSDRKVVLTIPQEELATHPLAGVLGAPLEAGEGMYLDLQNRYVFN